MRDEQYDFSRPYLDAIRLAVAGSANDETCLRVIDAILEQAPEGDGSETESVKIFLEAVKARDGQFVVPA